MGSLIGNPPAPTQRFPPNLVRNQKYTPWDFLPRTLYQQFKLFYNLYFLLVALSQLVPALRVGSPRRTRFAS